MRIDFNISQTERGKFRTMCQAVILSVGSASKAATIDAAEDIMSTSMAQVPIDTGALVFSAYCGVSRRVDLKSYRYGAVMGYGTSSAGASGRVSHTADLYSHDPVKTTKEPTAADKSWDAWKKTQGRRSKAQGRSSLSGSLSAGAGTGSSVSVGYTFGDIEWLMEPRNPINPKNGLTASAYAAIVHEDLGMPHPNGGKAKFLEDPVREYAAGKFRRTVVNYWRTAIRYASTGPQPTRYNARTGQWKHGSRPWVIKDLEKQRTEIIKGGK